MIKGIGVENFIVKIDVNLMLKWLYERVFMVDF